MVSPHSPPQQQREDVGEEEGGRGGGGSVAWGRAGVAVIHDVHILFRSSTTRFPPFSSYHSPSLVASAASSGVGGRCRHYFLLLQTVDQLNVELQSGVGRDRPGDAALPIGQLGRDNEGAAVAHAHAFHADVPTFAVGDTGRRTRSIRLGRSRDRAGGKTRGGGPNLCAPLITSPTPRRKVNGDPLLLSNTLPLEARRPTYFICTRLPMIATCVGGGERAGLFVRSK